MNFQEKYFQSGDLSIHYLEKSGEGPVLILLPGLTANNYIFGGLHKAGFGAGSHLVALDFRGRGKSDKPAGEYSIAAHAHDVQNLAGMFSKREVVLVGHSFGGLIGVWLCSHYPAFCDHLILLDVALESTDPKIVELLRPSLSRLGKEYASSSEYLELMRQAPYLSGYWDGCLEEYYRADIRTDSSGKVRTHTSPEIIGACIDAVLEENWAQLFQSLETKTLLINAVSDYSASGPLVPVEQAKRTQQLVPECTYRQVSGNHITMLFGENADQTVKTIHSWLGINTSSEGIKTS